MVELDRITLDPKVMGGKPCIKGTRVTVGTQIAAQTGEEHRHVVIAVIAGRHWSAVITYRRETIRLISVRRSRAREVQAYEGE